MSNLFVDESGNVQKVSPEIAKQSGWRPAERADIEQAIKIAETESVGGHLKQAGKAVAAGAFDAVTAVPRVISAGAAAAVGGEDMLEHVSGNQFLEDLTAVGTELAGGGTASRAGDQFKAQRQLEARVNPGTETASYIAGQVGGALATGGGSLATAAKAGTTKALGGGFLARMAGRGVAGAIEGAPLGMTQAQSDAYIEGRHLTAEQSMAGAGLGAAMGFGLNVAAGTAGEGLSKVFGKVKEGAQALANKAEDGSFLRKALGTSDEAVEKTVASTLKEDLVAPEVVGHVRDGFSGKNLAAVRDEIHNSAAREVASAANDGLKSVQRLVDKVDNKGWKLSQVEAREATFATDALEQTQAHASSIRQSVHDTIEQLGSDAPKTLKGLAAQLDRQEMAVRGATSPATANIAMDQIRRDLLSTSKAFERSARVTQNVDTQSLMRALSENVGGHYETAQKFLMDAETWGAQGEAQAAVNTARADLIRAERNHLGSFTQTLEGEEYLGAGRTRDVHVAHEGKLLSTIRNYGKPEGAVGERAIGDWLTSAKGFADATKKYGLDAGDHAAVGNVTNSLQKFERSIKDVTNKTAAVDQAQRFIATTTGSQGVFSGAAIAGSVLGGVPGAAVGMGLDAVLNPGKFLAQRMKFEQMALKTTERLQNGLGKFFDSMGASPVVAKVGEAAQSTARAARQAAVPSALGAFGAIAKTPELAFEKRREEIVTASADANGGVRKALAESYGDIPTHDPHGYAGAVLTATNALDFLRGKMPPGGPDPNSLTPMTSQLQPSKVEIQEFAEYWNAVNDPIGVIEAMADGETPSPEAIEALQVVVPRVYQQIRVSTMERLRQMDMAGEEVPVRQRMDLDTLLDLNGAGEPTFAPDFGAKYGALIGAPTPQQGPPKGRGGGSAGGIGKRLQTKTLSMIGG